MLARVLPWRVRREEGRHFEKRPSAISVPRGDSIDAINPFVLLTPTEGGLSFRLHTFPDADSARALAGRQLSPGTRQRAIAFRALHQRPLTGLDADSPEAVLMTRDPARPGVVYLSSFVDMHAARSFLRFEAERGLDLRLALLYWALPIAIDAESQFPDVAPRVVIEHARETAGVPEAVALPSTQSVAQHLQVRGPLATTETRPETPAVEKSSRQPRPAGLLARALAWPVWKGLRQRMMQATLLQETVYEDVQQDQNAAGQAAVILCLAALAAAIGAIAAGPKAMLVYSLASPLGWVIYAWLSCWLGTQVFRGRHAGGNPRASLLAFGFAGSPRLLFVLAIVPVYGPLLVLLALVWLAVATTVAAKHALELDEAEAAIIAMVSCLALFAASIVLPSLIA